MAFAESREADFEDHCLWSLLGLRGMRWVCGCGLDADGLNVRVEWFSEKVFVAAEKLANHGRAWAWMLRSVYFLERTLYFLLRAV